jgi:hypothetical protein
MIARAGEYDEAALPAGDEFVAHLLRVYRESIANLLRIYCGSIADLLRNNCLSALVNLPRRRRPGLRPRKLQVHAKKGVG